MVQASISFMQKMKQEDETLEFQHKNYMIFRLNSTLPYEKTPINRRNETSSPSNNLITSKLHCNVINDYIA